MAGLTGTSTNGATCRRCGARLILEWRHATEAELLCPACGERCMARNGEILAPAATLPIAEPRLEGQRTATERVLALRGLRPSEIAKRTRVRLERVTEILREARRREGGVH